MKSTFQRSRDNTGRVKNDELVQPCHSTVDHTQLLCLTPLSSHGLLGLTMFTRFSEVFNLETYVKTNSS